MNQHSSSHSFFAPPSLFVTGVLESNSGNLKVGTVNAFPLEGKTVFHFQEEPDTAEEKAQTESKGFGREVPLG